jgi:hypothetical protein
VQEEEQAADEAKHNAKARVGQKQKELEDV